MAHVLAEDTRSRKADGNPKGGDNSVGWTGDKLFALIALSSFMAKLICHRCLGLSPSQRAEVIEKCASDNCQKCRNNHGTLPPHQTLLAPIYNAVAAIVVKSAGCSVEGRKE